jgi:hypothetical protein
VTLDREFLDIRARLLDIAAALDRVERAAGPLASEPRLDQIRHAISLLDQPGAARAEQVQLLFSREFDPDWRAKFALEAK